jgi:hypothetical protein
MLSHFLSIYLFLFPIKTSILYGTLAGATGKIWSIDFVTKLWAFKFVEDVQICQSDFV